MKTFVVWGFGSLGSAVGVSSEHDSAADAEVAVQAAESTNNNPACGYWLSGECPTCRNPKALGLCADCR